MLGQRAAPRRVPAELRHEPRDRRAVCRLKNPLTGQRAADACQQQRTIDTPTGKRTLRREAMIFPRYHQLDAVRKLVGHARAHGAGRNYLVQHSAGSGKSNSIAWLAHRLASLHDANDTKKRHLALPRIHDAPGD